MRFAPPSPSGESFMDMMSPMSPEFGKQTYFPRSQDTASSTLSYLADSPTSARDHHTQGSMSSTTKSRPPVHTVNGADFAKSSSTASGRVKSPQASSSSPVTPKTSKFSLDAEAIRQPAVLPPTTNTLDAQERSERVKKMRKLAQVFGQSPSAVALSSQIDDITHGVSFLSTSPTRHPKQHRPAASVAVDVLLESPTRTPPRSQRTSSGSSRRHSAPLSPENYAALSDYVTAIDESYYANRSSIEISSQKGTPTSDHSVLPSTRKKGKIDSPTSFIDLSDEEGHGDDRASLLTIDASYKARRAGRLTPSVIAMLSPEEQVEEDRRKKRIKLAKLHRYLGSRVPTGLVLGLTEEGTSLPEESPTHSPEEESRPGWLRRRRSSMLAAVPLTPPEESPPGAEHMNTLTGKEKALFVKRAHKMEKVISFAVYNANRVLKRTFVGVRDSASTILVSNSAAFSIVCSYHRCPLGKSGSLVDPKHSSEREFPDMA